MFHDEPKPFHCQPFEEPEPAPVQDQATAAMHVPTPVHAAATPLWLFAAANGYSSMHGPATPLAAADGKGPGASAAVNSVDPWSIFSPPPAPRQSHPRARRNVNTTKYRAVPSIGQAFPGSKASEGPFEEKDTAGSKK